MDFRVDAQVHPSYSFALSTKGQNYSSVSIDQKVVSERNLAQEFKFGVGVPAGRFSMTINFARSAACI
jgi:hypothetical protein